MSLKEEIESIRSSKRDLRKFCLIIAIVIIGWGFIFFFRGRHFCNYFFIIAIILLISGVVYPVFIKPLYKLAAITTVFWRWLLTKSFLWAIFFLGFTLINFIARLFGKRFLKLKPDKNANSYWLLKKKNEFKKDNYERQF